MSPLRVRVLERDDLDVEGFQDIGSRGPHMIHFKHLGVPLPECIRAELGSHLADIVESLRLQGFDQAPVRVPSSPIGWRLVARHRLESLNTSGHALDEQPDHYQANDFLQVETVYVPLRTLFGHLCASQAAIVCCCESLAATKVASTGTVIHKRVWVDASSDNATDATIYGLVTHSDLNRREVRKAAYELVLDLEDALAELVRRRFQDPWEWICHAGDAAQVRILGQWQQAKQREIEIDPVEFAMIGELLSVVRSTDYLRTLLEVPDGKKLESLSWKVVDFRNRVMHPARQLVLGQGDVIRAHDAIEFMGILVKRLESILAG